ncbi:MAG TPA: sugar porter family MFS transporter [Gammaproteobacteria bacterium]|nr:sugar porter family MFS transporter [Gammaproteobacteria bacterium]
MRIRKIVLIAISFSGLGGILYGYDIGIISGALLFMKGSLALTPSEMSLIVSAVLGGGSLAILFAGPFADRYGRRVSIILAAATFIAGVIVLIASNGFAMALAGRLIQGIGVGILTIVVPLYIVEVMPPALRGRSVALFQLCLTFGILLGYVVGYALNGSGDWRAMFATALIPSIAFLIGGFLLPPSPGWLYRRGRQEEARAALLQTQNVGEAAHTFNEMVELAEQERDRSVGGWRLLLRPGYRKAFSIALAVGILNQLTGINTLLQFNTVILHQSGLHGGGAAVLGSVGVGIANFVLTLIALLLIDKVGRRPLLIFGTAGVTIALAFIGVVHAAFPPSAFQGYATLGGFIAFIIFFAVGPGTVVWLAISEILPLAIRAKGMAVALFANSLISAGLAAAFMSIVAAIGYSGIFFVLAGFVFLYFLIAVFPLPETRGRSLEDIERHFLGQAADTSILAQTPARERG